MFKQSSLILGIILYLLSNSSFILASSSPCSGIFKASPIFDPLTPISEILSYDIDTSLYDTHTKAILNQLKSLSQYASSHPNIYPYDLEELTSMFNLLASTLFLPIGQDLKYYLSSSDIDLLIEDPRVNFFDPSTLNPKNSAHSLDDLLSFITYKIDSSYNSYYNIYKYLSIASARFGYSDFHYRIVSDIQPEPLIQYGSYYVSSFIPPFTRNDTFLFNHPHLRWMMYLLNKIDLHSSFSKEHLLLRWENSLALQVAIPSFNQTPISTYNISSFLKGHFIQKTFKFLYGCINGNWDIPFGLLLEQLLRYPLLVKDLAKYYYLVEPRDYNFIFNLSYDPESWIQKIKFNIDSSDLQSIDKIDKNFFLLYDLISRIDPASQFKKDERISLWIDPLIINMIVALNYWLDATKSSNNDLPSYEKYQDQYNYIYSKLHSLSNMNRALIIWFIAYKTHQTIEDLIIMDENFIDWVIENSR